MKKPNEERNASRRSNRKTSRNLENYPKSGQLGMRPSMRKITQQSVMLKNLCIGETKLDTRREREREAQRISLFIRCNSYKYEQPPSKGYKVTLYSDSLRATALYAIYINSPSLGYPRGQCEYVHYTFVFDTPP